MGEEKEQKEEKKPKKKKPPSNPTQIDPSGTKTETTPSINLTAPDTNVPKPDNDKPKAPTVQPVQQDPSGTMGLPTPAPIKPKQPVKAPPPPPVIKTEPPKKKKPSGIGITISSNTGGSNTPATISTGNVYKDPVTGSTIQTGQTVKDVKEGKYNPSVIDSTTGNFLGESSTPTQVEEKNTTLGKAKGTGQIPESPQSMTTVSVNSPSGVMAVKNLGGKLKDEKGASGHPKYGKIKTVANPYGEGSPIGAGEGTIAAGDYDTNPAVKKQTDTMLKTMAGNSTPSQDLVTGEKLTYSDATTTTALNKTNPALRRILLSGGGAGGVLRRLFGL
jgi:hypothetical protein